MRTMVTLENLSDDVLYQIVGHLRSERSFTLRCLRIVSSRLKIFAESILYRKLVLQDDDDHELASSGFIERLQNPLDTLSQHVRNLHVKSFRGDDESCCMNTNLLLTCLKRLRRLDSFSWDCDFPIPNEIMDTLHLRWPQAQLRATMKDLDYKTLQSPQLHCLRVCLPKLVSDPVITINLWNSVKRVLLYCPKLRALSIDVRPVATDRFTLVVTPEVPPGLNTTNTTVSSYYDDSRPPDHTEALSALDQKIQLPLTRDDGLFELHDLNIRARSYTLDLEHCQLLLGCLDTNKLQRLRLGPSNPKHFFNTFAGQLTHLQHDITFMLQPESWYPAIAYPVFELVNCAEFTTSLISLRSLIIRCNVVSWHDPLWARLADAHGTRLRHLSIQAHQPDRQAPEIIGALPHMLRQFTALTTLHLALQESDTYNHLCAFCDHGTDASGSGYVDQIPPLPNLTTLSISIKLSTSLDWSLRTHLLHKTPYIHYAIRKLWSKFKSRSTPHALETCSVEVWRWELASVHADEYGRLGETNVRKVVFESRIIDGRLEIRLRGDVRMEPVYYRVAHHPWERVEEQEISLKTCFLPCEPHEERCWAGRVFGSITQ